MKNGAKGIDVSNYQGNIDWSKVKSDGIEFVIIRAGWGKNSVDAKFKTYIENAIKQDLNIGIYWFLYGKTEADVIANAVKCDSVIKPYKDKINMKVWADWEYDSDNYCKGLNKTTRTKWVKAFCNKLTSLGYKTGIYANPDYIKNKFNDISDYPLWLAYYSSTKGSYNPLIWQHSSKGRVNGISGNVDMDIYYGEEIANNKTVVQVPVTQPMMNTLTTEYKVKKGDTLNSISVKFKVPLKDIIAVNPQIKNPNLINVGQVIKIPTTKVEVKVETKPTYIEYKVKKGDTLGNIAIRNKTTVAKILELNPKITNPNIINVGQIVKIPK